MKDYIPEKDGDLVTWSDNFSVKIPAYATDLGLSANDVKEAQNACLDIDNSIKANVQMQADAKKMATEKALSVHKSTGVVRIIAQRSKKASGYTEAIGKVLGIIGADDPFNPNTYKPEISAAIFPGHVTVKFTKKGVQGVNIYSRLHGDANWEKLSFDSFSPYVDNRPLHVAGTPEMRQYMAIGVVHDHEIGQMSDIIEATFAG